MTFRVIRHGVVDSTNERAFAALANGSARHGDAHVGTAQTAGRGSRGRAWHSPEGDGLYASVVLLPDAPPRTPALLTMAAALGVLDLLQSLGAGELRLKWPNDVLASGGKICGILVESRGLDPKRPAYVCGMGLNVRQRTFPPDVEERGVTSLGRLGVDQDPAALIVPLLNRLETRLASAFTTPETLVAAFAEATGLLGSEALITSGEEQHRGRIVGFGLDGVSLETPGGRRLLLLEHVTAVEPN